MEYALVILCGGNSTRMGSDKALLPFGDYCLIEYLVRKFSPHFSRIYLSVKKKGDYSHLNLQVTEIPDIYPNAGPMSGIFSGLSMIHEEAAFFMSVDTPFMEPETGIALLEAMDDSDICTIRGKAGYLETSTAAYHKNCITSIGKCLLLHQFTFKTLREKCRTRYITEKALSDYTTSPIDVQFYNLDTRNDYYHALRMLSGISHPDSKNALIEYFSDNKDLFSHAVPVLSIVSKPGTITTPFLERLIPLLKRDGLEVLHLRFEDKNVVFHKLDFLPLPENLAAALTSSDLILLECPSTVSGLIPQHKVEFLRKDWSETPLNALDELLAIIADFPYEATSTTPVYDMNKPRDFLHFIHKFLSDTHR